MIELDLHTVASKWYALNGYADEAIWHSLQGDDMNQATQYIKHFVDDARKRGRGNQIEQWLEQLPNDVFKHNPDLNLVRAWLMRSIGRWDSVQDTVKQLKSDDTYSIEAKILGLLAPLSHERELDGAEKEREDLLKTLTDRRYKALTLYSLGHVQSLKLKINEALKSFTDAHTLMRLDGYVNISTYCLSRIGQIHMSTGRLHEAQNTYKQMMFISQEYDLDHTPIVGRAYYGIGKVFRERGKLAQATKYLAKALEYNLQKSLFTSDLLVSRLETLSKSTIKWFESYNGLDIIYFDEFHDNRRILSTLF